MMDIKRIMLILFCFISNLNSRASSHNDTNDIKNWHTVKNYKLSDNGLWAVIFKIYMNNKDTVLVQSTRNNTLYKFTDIKNIDILENTLITTTEKDVKKITFTDLTTSKQTQILSINKYTLIAKEKSICFLNSESKEFHIQKLKHSSFKSILKIPHIDNYFINDNQTKLMLIQNQASSTQIHFVDLVNLKHQVITVPLCDINTAIWDNKDESLIVKNKNQQTVYISINDLHYQVINTLFDTKDIALYEIGFTENKMLFLRYNILTEKKEEYSKYLDIWNGNEPALEKKILDSSIKTIRQHNYLYNLKTDTYKEISNPKDINIIPFFNIPFFLTVDYSTYKDYSTYNPQADITLHSYYTNKVIYKWKQLLSSKSTDFTHSPDQNFIAFKINKKWNIYDISENKVFEISDLDSQQNIIWNKKNLLIVANNNLFEYDLTNHRLTQITKETEKNLSIELVNAKSQLEPILNTSISSIWSVDYPIILHITNNNTNTQKLLIIKDKTIKQVIETSNRITQVKWSNDYKTITFLQENYNTAPELLLYHDEQLNTLIESDITKELYQNRKQLIITYQDKYGIELKGILYYPKSFEKDKKYPMITHLYEKQYQLANYFLEPITTKSTGYNLATFFEKDYFVFLPDTYVSKDGPGVTALNCVENSIEQVLKKEKSIDQYKLGIIGSSFGGYLVNYIITQTNLFKTAISGVSVSDIVWDYNSYNYNFPKPSYWKYENGQYGTNPSLGNDISLYLKNNPILYAQNVNTPLLTYTGLKDENVPWENTRHFYIALKRYNKQQIALFYKNEGHAIVGNDAQNDLNLRIQQWFDYFLKDQKQVKWINQGI